MSRSLLALSPSGQHEAGQVLRHCPRILLGARETIDAGDLPTAKLFVVERGFALLAAARPGWRRPVILSLAGAGAVLPPPASGERLGGLTETVVIAIPAAAHDRLLAFPEIAGALVEALLDALCERQESFANATGGRHPERLRSTLFQLARTHGKVCRDGIEIELPLTHELLAQMIGCARETVTCTLTHFQRDGFLTRSGRGYRLTISPADLDPGRAQFSSG